MTGLHESALPLRKRVIAFSSCDQAEMMCWDLGAFTSTELHDPDVSHVIVSSQHKSIHDPGSTFVVQSTWLTRCHMDKLHVDEEEYLAGFKIQKFESSKVADALRRPESVHMMALCHKPSNDSLSSNQSKPHPSHGIARRRSDAASMPLRPDGVFKGLSFSLFGWADSRLETSLSYQLTSNGANIVKLIDADQYACICADGSRPTTQMARILSTRWVNDCLAHGELQETSLRHFYVPSLSQLPILLTAKVCLYITEKDELKFEEIAELAKLIGIKFISRSESRVPVSAVTHFIFHDTASFERRRDLIPIAKKNGKFIVSYDWLKDSYLLGQLSDEGNYHLGQLLAPKALTDAN